MSTYIITQDTLDKLKASAVSLDALLGALTPEPVPPPKPEIVATFLMLAVHPEEWSNYRQLETAKTHVAMVTYRYDTNDAITVGFDNARIPYYFTASTSGFPGGEQKSLYEPIADVQDILTRPACQGVVLSESVTYAASIINYDWDRALDNYNWAWLDAVVAAAKAHGKTVVWSEPSDGWPRMVKHPVAQAHLATYGRTVVPMYATNFTNPDLGLTEAGTQAVSHEFGMALGMSHQSWYFVERGLTFTAADSQALAQRGHDAGATYFEVEGPADYMLWSNPYMQGIADFATTL